MTAAEIRAEAVDAALSAWNQGDCVVGEHWFLFRADPEQPITAESQEACDPDTGNAEASVRGFAVLTQTCDIVRACVARPFIEISPLTQLSEQDWPLARRGSLPRYAIVPGLEDQRFAADLDRVMTVEKAVVARWARVSGCRNDRERRDFAAALARKRSRPAFPDDFVAVLERLRRRLVGKHDKDSDEGRALRALREIRARAAPDWSAAPAEVTLWFIREEGMGDFEGCPWHKHLDAWMSLIDPADRFQVSGLVTTLDELTARDYLESDALDLGHLSQRALSPQNMWSNTK